jgi:hypothetical protein
MHQEEADDETRCHKSKLEEKKAISRSDKLSFYRCLRLMLKRSYTNQVRQPIIISTRISQVNAFNLSYAHV